MKLDKISELLVALALKLQEKNAGLISEIWIAENELNALRTQFDEIPWQELSSDFDNLINEITDKERKTYLQATKAALTYQLADTQSSSLAEFYQNVYSTKVACISDDLLAETSDALLKLEKDCHLYRHDIFRRHYVAPDRLLAEFRQQLEAYKQKLPRYLQTEANFEYEVVAKAPWSAFNAHFAPFKSKLTLNSASGITSLDLKLFAVHEAFGGHHTELSLKDMLLIEEHRGEHGFIAVYSPQVFISEGIAESAFDFLGYASELSAEEQIMYLYGKLSDMVNNKAVFLYHDESKSQAEVEDFIDSFDMGRIGKANMINFILDPVFGKYSAIYYSAHTFIMDKYNAAADKQRFLLNIYTNPVLASTL